MGVLLIVGRNDDPCCVLVSRALQRRGREVLWLPEERLFPELEFVWNVSASNTLSAVGHGGERVAFDRIDGVLARFYGIPVSAEAFETKDGRYVSAEWAALALAWTSALRCPVVNRLKPELWYKPWLNIPSLLALVPRPGLKLPRTIMTTRIDEARLFFRRCGSRAWYVPISPSRRYALESEADLDKLAKLERVLPFQLMSAMEGESLDAFVIGDDVLFATGRGVPREGLPVPIASSCLEVARALGLAFCQLSLVLDGVQEDEPAAWCLGVNRLPQLHALGGGLQDAIAERLATLLVSGGGRLAQ